MIKYILIFILSFASVYGGIELCVDLNPPAAPTDLIISGNVGNITLKWETAFDTPECSGIDSYVINREGIQIGIVDESTLIFTDNSTLKIGEYVYTVFAVDKAGHNNGTAVKNTIRIEDGGIGRAGGGGETGSGSAVCEENWNCGEWTDCVGNMKRRICEDLEKCGTLKNKPLEFSECNLEKENLTILEPYANRNSDGFFNAITGGIIGVPGKTGIEIIAGLILVLAGSLVFIIFKKRKQRKNSNHFKLLKYK